MDCNGRVWLLEINSNCGFNHHGQKHAALTQHLVVDMLQLIMQDINLFLPVAETSRKGFVKNGFVLIGQYNPTATTP